MKNVLITGVTGQDGSYLSKLLLDKGYRVFGTHRRTSSIVVWRLEYLNIINHPNFVLLEIDLTDLSSILRCIKQSNPEIIFNLAAQSFVAHSFNSPITTAEITGVGVLNVLEAIRLSDKRIKFYQASSSEMFGKVKEVPQNELTPFHPRSPYGVAKVFGHWATVNYRESYDIFAVSGILFNHESPLRGMEFVTRKITSNLAKIKIGKTEKFSLGNIYAKRDWGYAYDYVNGMYLMMNQEMPDDYVLATGKTYSIKDFINICFEYLQIDIEWKGKGIDEIAFDKKTGKTIIEIDEKFYRPAEVDLLVGSPEKAHKKLGWKPETDIKELAAIMLDSDLRLFSND